VNLKKLVEHGLKTGSEFVAIKTTVANQTGERTLI
jgi:hypothetical protein